MRAWLNENFPGRWIGRRGPIDWPARSCDLTPPDFFLWAYLKDKVYATKPRSIQDLKDRIRNEMEAIPVDLCQKVCHSVKDRLRQCIEKEGGQII